MAVGQYALTTVAKVYQYLHESETDVQDEAFAAYCSATDATAATIAVTDDSWVGTITGGTSAATTTLTLANASYDTLTELVAAIDGTAGWTARLLGQGGSASTDLIPFAAVNALAQSNEKTHYILDTAFIETLIDAVSAKVETLIDRQILSRTYTELYDGNPTEWLHLNQYPVTSVERVSIQRDRALTVKHTGSVTASVEVRAAGTMVLIDRTSGTTNTNTLTLSSYTTMTLLAAAINALTGWSATITAGFENYNPSEIITAGGKWAVDRWVDVEVPADALEYYELRADDALYRSGGWAGPPRSIWVKYTAGESSTPADLQLLVSRLTAEAFKSSSRDEHYQSFRLADYAYTLADKAVEGVFTTDVAAELEAWRRIPMPRFAARC